MKAFGFEPMIGGCQRLNVVEANPKVRYFDTDRT